MEAWSLKKLNLLILEGIEESASLEYKGPLALQRNDKSYNDLSKDVSSFANSGGGVIIYGMSEHQDEARKHRPEKIDPIDRSAISKEWLEQKLNAIITPRIQDIKIIPIVIDSDIDRVVYVLEIPQSTTAHQASDNKYYKRYNFSSIPMQDWEVKDVISRRTKREVEFSFELLEEVDIWDYDTQTSDLFDSVAVYITNTSNKVINYLEVYIYNDDDRATYLLRSQFGKPSNTYLQVHTNLLGSVSQIRKAILPGLTSREFSLIFSKAFLKSNATIKFKVSLDDNVMKFSLSAHDITEVFKFKKSEP